MPCVVLYNKSVNINGSNEHVQISNDGSNNKISFLKYREKTIIHLKEKCDMYESFNNWQNVPNIPSYRYYGCNF